MNKHAVVFTSEAVTAGHPDRLCDTISDAIVDRFLMHDPNARIVAECALAKGVVFIAARFASQATIDIPELARSVIREVGYDKADFDAEECTVITSLISLPEPEHSLSPEQIVAQNQVTAFGFACTHTPELMPLPIVLARRLANALFMAKQQEHMPYLSPDGTVQIGVELVDGRPIRIHSLALTVGFASGRTVSTSRLRREIDDYVIGPAFHNAPLALDSRTEIFLNTPFARSGPAAHSGMTGRKTASDTYGAYARHSGSALSGKDPWRIDRTAAYAARYVAKNLVAAGLAEACEVQLSYAIGQAQPVSVQVDCFGTGRLSDEEILTRLGQVFDLRVGVIVTDFRLPYLPAEHPGGFYQKLPVCGHFGDSAVELPWERTDKAKILQQ
ncbi:MAG: methionine adenosyltransferase [Methylohalobius sp.]|nr:methionine adenosyltransferase [Methylohalobius sp.]